MAALWKCGTWRISLRALLHLDRSQLHVFLGLRLALGVAIPLIAGIATGHSERYAYASAGAFGVGFGAFLGVYRTKAATMLAAAAAIAVSLFVGAVAGHSPLLVTVLVWLWGLGAGLLGAFGPAAYFVGLQAVLYLLLGSGLPAAGHDASVRALFALAGGTLQTLLVVGVWPLRHFVAERRALSDAYRTLARYADGVPQTGMPPRSLAASGIYSALADPHPFADRRNLWAFQRLLDEAERIRMSLAALAASVPRSRANARGPIARVARASSEVLDEIASAIQAGRAPDDTRKRQALRSVESTLMQPDDAAGPRGHDRAHAHDALPAQVGALLAQLRAAWRIAKGTGEDADALPAPSPGGRRFPMSSGIPGTLRASLTLRSSTFRHALRVAIVVALATAVYQTTGRANGYWFPVAALFVLQPAFGETLTRGLGMMSGTVAGAAVATVIASVWRLEGWTLAALIVVIAWSCFTTFRANYALFAGCITAYIVFLTSSFGMPEPVAALNRVVGTVAGGSLALLAFWLWPTWEARLVPERLAAVLDAQAAYAAKVLSGFPFRDAQHDGGLAQARLAAQLARTNAEDSVERMLAEPRLAGKLASSTALGILAAIRTFVVASLTLDAARHGAGCPPWPALRSLAEAIELALVRIASALRSGGSPSELPPLREMHASLAGATERPGDATSDDAAADDLVPSLSSHRNGCASLHRLAISETDLMVDSIDTMAELLAKADGLPVTLDPSR